MVVLSSFWLLVGHLESSCMACGLQQPCEPAQVIGVHGAGFDRDCVGSSSNKQSWPHTWLQHVCLQLHGWPEHGEGHVHAGWLPACIAAQGLDCSLSPRQNHVRPCCDHRPEWHRA